MYEDDGFFSPCSAVWDELFDVHLVLEKMHACAILQQGLDVTDSD